MTTNYQELLEYLLEQTMQCKGTDLHLCAGTRPLMRVNSKLIEIPDTEIMTKDAITEFVKANLTTDQINNLKLHKSVDFSYSKAKLGRFRCNVYIQRGTYAMAIRTLPLEIPAFDELGLPLEIKQFIHKSKGLILVTGSTGCGKSTTLASLIGEINDSYKYHIITIEDPLEYLHKHKNSMVTQREVGDDANSFSSALVASLREDPDVIMVGEMRDMETTSIALTAAETGHLVFSTLHTNGAVKSIDRIIDMFPTEQQNQVKSQLATVLEGIVSQQLIPSKDGNTMIPVCELLIATTAVRNLIRDGKHYQINNLIQSGKSQGMISMERTMAKLVLENQIHDTEARYRVQDIQLYESYLEQM